MRMNPAAHAAVAHLHATYADVVTRRSWTELGPLFTADATIDVDTVTRPAVHLEGSAALADFIAGALERFAFFELVPLNSVVTSASPDAATGRLWMVELRQERESGHWSEAYGRYDDDYAIVDGHWRYRRRSYRSLARRSGLTAAEVFPAAD
jgi:hypothetical protein